MTDQFAYKPRLGIDIRIKPPREEKVSARTKSAKVDAEEVVCAWPGCTEKGKYRAPNKSAKSKGKIEYQLLCLAHIREFNRSWNYFADMNEDEIARQAEEARLGERPTWAFGRNKASAADI